MSVEARSQATIESRLRREERSLRREGRRIARRAGLTPSEAEHVCQEALLACWRTEQKGEEIESLRGLFIEAARLHALWIARRNESHPTEALDLIPEDDEFVEEALRDAPLEHPLVGHDPSPHDLAERSWELLVVEEILAELPDLWRRLVKLRWGLELSPGEIRARLGLSEYQFRRHFRKASAYVFDRAAAASAGGWCEDRRGLLLFYALGHATTEQTEQAEHHLAGCPGCRRMVRDQRRVMGALGIVLPPPLMASGLDAPLGALIDLAGTARQGVTDLLVAGKQQVYALASRLSGVGQGESTVGGAAAGGFGAAGTAKVAVGLCLGAGSVGAGAYCVEALVPDSVPTLKRVEAKQKPEGRKSSSRGTSGVSIRAAKADQDRRRPRGEKHPRQERPEEKSSPTPSTSSPPPAATPPPAPERPPGAGEFSSSPESGSGGGSSAGSTTQSSEFSNQVERPSSSGSSSSSGGGSATGSSGGEFGP